MRCVLGPGAYTIPVMERDCALRSSCSHMPQYCSRLPLRVTESAAYGRHAVTPPSQPLCCSRLLPLVAADTQWSPERHAAYPADFRRAAQTLLLINEHRGFGGGVVGDEGREGGLGLRLPAGVQTGCCCTSCAWLLCCCPCGCRSCALT